MKLRHLAPLLLLILILPGIVAAHAAHAAQPLYAFCGNRTHAYAALLEQKVLGSIEPGQAVQLLLHAEAKFPVAYCGAPAAVDIGPVRVLLDIRKNLPLFPTELSAWLVVEVNGRKVYEKRIASIGMGQNMYPEATVMVRYACDGHSIIVEAKAGDASYTATAPVDGGSIALLAEAGSTNSLTPPNCHSYVKVEKTAKLECRGENTGQVDWGEVKPGEKAGDTPFQINLDLNKVAMTAIAVGGGIAALLGALFIISMRK